MKMKNVFWFPFSVRFVGKCHKKESYAFCSLGKIHRLQNVINELWKWFRRKKKVSLKPKFLIHIFFRSSVYHSCFLSFILQALNLGFIQYDFPIRNINLNWKHVDHFDSFYTHKISIFETVSCLNLRTVKVKIIFDKTKIALCFFFCPWYFYLQNGIQNHFVAQQRWTNFWAILTRKCHCIANSDQR